MNYPSLKQRLLTQILIQEDSIALSRRLGYAFNQVERWLNGTKQCRWSEFWDLAEELKLPLIITLREVFALDIKTPAHDSAAEDVDPALFLRHLRLIHSHESIEQIAAAIHLHPSTLKRYFRGDTSCDLDVVLALIDHAPQRLDAFLLRLLGTEAAQKVSGDFELPLFAEEHGTEPLAAALEAALRLVDYTALPSHSDAFVAHHIGCSTNEATALLQQMEKRGSIRKTDDSSGKYTPTYEYLQMEGVTREQICRFVRYWSYRSYLRLARVDNKPITLGENPSFVGFRIAALSKNATQKIGEALRRHHQELISIADSDQDPKTDIRVILVQDFSAQDTLDQNLQRAPLEPSIRRDEAIATEVPRSLTL
ncbi:MAG: helix-turn-helix transcriptional regulator [Bdellovibrionales bacterium]|nr:helix-turn-helix transcriptional regulator [Bdellovibrionales bacterium]